MTHYEVLGVDTNATFDEIKDSYRQKLLVLHPDKQPTVNTRSLDSNDGFLQLRVAWDVLSNETLRHDYDLMLRVQISKTNKIGLEQVIATTTEASTEYPVIFSCSCSTLISVQKEDFEDATEMQLQCENCSKYVVVHRPYTN